jgi:hypothetical protein
MPRTFPILPLRQADNPASEALTADLKACGPEIEQHAITLRIADHQKFIASIFDRLNSYGS